MKQSCTPTTRPAIFQYFHEIVQVSAQKHFPWCEKYSVGLLIFFNAPSPDKVQCATYYLRALVPQTFIYQFASVTYCCSWDCASWYRNSVWTPTATPTTRYYQANHAFYELPFTRWCLDAIPPAQKSWRYVVIRTRSLARMEASAVLNRLSSTQRSALGTHLYFRNPVVFTGKIMSAQSQGKKQRRR